MTEPRQAIAFTYDVLRSAPDDSYRRELVEGQLLVSPAPDTCTSAASSS
jgi:hypothetical protein